MRISSSIQLHPYKSNCASSPSDTSEHCCFLHMQATRFPQSINFQHRICRRNVLNSQPQPQSLQPLCYFSHSSAAHSSTLNGYVFELSIQQTSSMSFGFFNLQHITLFRQQTSSMSNSILYLPFADRRGRSNIIG